MQRQRLVAVQEQVERLVESDLTRSREAQAARGADASQRGLDRLRVDLVRAVPLEAEQHRAVGAMPEPGERE